MKKLIVVSLLVLASPFMASVNNNQSASMVAYAGRTIVGGYYCTCGQPNCIYDPGECDGHNTNQQGQSPKGGTVEFSIVIVALMLWLRLRA
jgi:hypothetical protein